MIMSTSLSDAHERLIAAIDKIDTLADAMSIIVRNEVNQINQLNQLSQDLGNVKMELNQLNRLKQSQQLPTDLAGSLQPPPLPKDPPAGLSPPACRAFPLASEGQNRVDLRPPGSLTSSLTRDVDVDVDDGPPSLTVLQAAVRCTCDMCKWRNEMIRTDSGEFEQAVADSRQNQPRSLLPDLHESPNDVWIKIINTQTLSPPEPPTRRRDSLRMWVRIPLRLDKSNRTAVHEKQWYWFEGVQYQPSQMVTVYHNTHVSHLVEPTMPFEGQMDGKGILNDQRLRYGRGTHAGCKGVEVHAYGSLDQFEGCHDRVQLEIHACGLEKLTNTHFKYCMKGEAPNICMRARLVALWVPMDEVPRMLLAV